VHHRPKAVRIEVPDELRVTRACAPVRETCIFYANSDHAVSAQKPATGPMWKSSRVQKKLDGLITSNQWFTNPVATRWGYLQVFMVRLSLH
jgi:hypothetical protein